MNDEQQSIILLWAIKGAILSMEPDTPEAEEARELFEQVETNSREILRLRSENERLSDRMTEIIGGTLLGGLNAD